MGLNKLSDYINNINNNKNESLDYNDVYTNNLKKYKVNSIKELNTFEKQKFFKDISDQIKSDTIVNDTDEIKLNEKFPFLKDIRKKKNESEYTDHVKKEFDKVDDEDINFEDNQKVIKRAAKKWNEDDVNEKKIGDYQKHVKKEFDKVDDEDINFEDNPDIIKKAAKKWNKGEVNELNLDSEIKNIIKESESIYFSAKPKLYDFNSEETSLKLKYFDFYKLLNSKSFDDLNYKFNTIYEFLSENEQKYALKLIAEDINYNYIENKYNIKIV